MTKEEYIEEIKAMGVIVCSDDEPFDIPNLNDGHEGEFVHYEPLEEEEEKIQKYKNASKEALPFLWKSQLYQFGQDIMILNDIFIKMDLPYERKKRYLETIRMLYQKCIDETLTSEIIQESLFTNTDILDTLIEVHKSAGEKIKEDLAFQYVCIQLAQLEEENRNL